MSTTTPSSQVVTAASGQLDHRTVQSLIDATVQRRNSRRQPEALVLDLSGVTFVTPFALVTLAAVLEKRDGRSNARLLCPLQSDCRQYLAVSGFLQQVAAFSNVEGDSGLAASTPSGADTVLPLIRMDQINMLQALRDLVQERLGLMFAGREHQRRREIAPILSTIQEACANVFQHAECPVGWLAAQRYLNHFTGKAYVEIAIADAGRGIRESLATRFRDLHRAADGEAIERMLARGLSRFDDPYRGNGYQVLQEATRERDGSFYLRSGTGAVGRPRRSALHREDYAFRWPGTQLQVRLTCA